jgi:hypothetical protein
MDAFTTPAIVETLDGQFVEVPDAKPVAFATAPTALRPADAPLVTRVSSRHSTASAPAAPRRTVYREAAPVQERVVVDEAPQRSWGKTALIVGGSAASGAGVGAIIGGKKGALAGAAIGGGAASLYEATRRR